MAKRRAEDALLHDSPSKRCARSRSLCGADLRPGAGGVHPPSLLALLGSRSRKRPYYFQEPEEEEEAALSHAGNVLTVQISGSFQDGRGSKKRPREEPCTGPETVVPEVNDKADEDTNTEDCIYNSFQFWRTPLPELDLSLLEDAEETKDKSKVKNSSSDVMET